MTLVILSLLGVAVLGGHFYSCGRLGAFEQRFNSGHPPAGPADH